MRISNQSTSVSGRFSSGEQGTYLSLACSTVRYISVRDFLGSPVIKSLHFKCRGHSFNPWLGTKIPHDPWPKKKKKKRYKSMNLYKCKVVELLREGKRLIFFFSRILWNNWMMTKSRLKILIGLRGFSSSHGWMWELHYKERQEEKGTTEDEMVGWHHQLYGHECE